VVQEDGSCIIPGTGYLENALDRTVNTMSLFAMHTPPNSVSDFPFDDNDFDTKRQARQSEYPLRAPPPDGPLVVDYSKYLPYAVSQGSCGSCVVFSFTTTALMYTNMFRDEYDGLPPVRADYGANLECYDWDKWEFENTHTWSIKGIVRSVSEGTNVTTKELKEVDGLGGALIDHLNAAAGTKLTIGNYAWAYARGDGKIRLDFSTENDVDEVNPLLTKELWEASSLSVYSYNDPVSLSAVNGKVYAIDELILKAERNICDGAHYDWVSTWQAEQQTVANIFRRDTTGTAPFGHLPLTLQEGQVEKRYFDKPDRTQCSQERALAQRGGEPSVDHIVSMSSIATQLLDEDLQSEVHTELDLGMKMPNYDGRGEEHWESWVTNSSFNIMYALTRYGPVSLAINVCDGFTRLRGSGVAQDFDCKTWSGHQIVLVGFDYDPARPIHENFFLIANSWGRNWGNNGVGRIAFGSSSIKYGVVPIYNLRVPEYPFAFSHDRFSTVDEALRNKHVYPGSVLAAEMFEREKDIVPFPSGNLDYEMWQSDNPRELRTGVLDPPVGPGRWIRLPTDGSPARRRTARARGLRFSGKTMATLPRLVVQTLNVVVAVSDRDMEHVRKSELKLRVNVWSGYEGGPGREGRPMVYPLGTITVNGGSFRQEACDSDMRACSRWLGSASFIMLPDLYTAVEASDFAVPDDQLVANMLPADEWAAVEMVAEWSGKAASKDVALYYYGSSVKINRPASEYYGLSFLDKGRQLTFGEIHEYNSAAFDTVPAGWRTSTRAGEAESSGLSTTTIIIIAGGSVCAVALCLAAACVGVLVLRRTSRSSKISRQAISGQPSHGSRSRSHTHSRSRRASDRHLSRA